MIFADNLIQVDVGGVVAIVGAIVAGLAGGATGAAKLFVGYMQAKDEKHEADRAAIASKHESDLKVIIDRLEALLASGDMKDSKHDAEFRLLYDRLMTLHGDTAKTVTQAVESMRLLGATMAEIKTAISQLSDRVGQIEKAAPHRRGPGPG